MNIKFYQLSGNLYFLIVFFFLMISQSKTATGQSTPRVQKEFDKLAQAYHSDRMSADQYFERADSLVHQLLSEGKHFETKELVGLLDLYEEIAWSKPQYSRGRIRYFSLFFNNARMFEKNGASMYYAEKITGEYKKNGKEHPLIEQLQKCKIYLELRLYDKIISIFKNERRYLTRLPGLLQHDQIDNSVGLNAMYIFSPALAAYIKMNDTASVYQTALLAKKIGTTLQHKYPINRRQMLYNDLLMIDIEHSVAKFDHRYDSAGILLNHMEALKTTYKDQATNFINVNLIRMRTENYLALKNQDSIRLYITKYESLPSFAKNKRADITEYKGQLHALQGDYRGAYTLLTNAVKLERDVQTAMMAESNDLLYAYTQAEHSGIALQRAEKGKQQRTVWLLIISFSASIIVLVIYLIMLRRSRKAKVQVQVLNNVANMQIVAMEEVKHQAVREEQQRLGQDLHDGLSSSIAGMRHQLETLSMDIDNSSLKNKLVALQVELANAYEAARNKSHEWFNTTDEQQEQSFEKQIRLLTDSALPDSRYNKTIHIDNNSLTNVSMDTRIALLRIIQEAITNIIKHARAKNVGILIYEEMDSLILTINDDGKGLDEKKSGSGKSTMGLQSIRRRVQYLNGETKIHSDTNGTEIIVSIPLVLS